MNDKVVPIERGNGSLGQTGENLQSGMLNQLNEAKEIRRNLQIMTRYKAPEIKAEAVAKAKISFPEYTIDKYAKDVVATATEQQKEMTLAFTDMSLDISALAGRMKESVSKILDLLTKFDQGEDVALNDFKKPLVFVERSAKAGQQMANNVQGKLVTLNQHLSSLRAKAETVREAYKPIIPKLRDNYNEWALKNGRQNAETLENAYENLKADISALQHEIKEKEKGMIAAGSVGSASLATVWLGLPSLLGTIACSIAVGVMGKEREALIARASKLQEKAETILGGIEVKVFIANIFDDLDEMESVLRSLQEAVDSASRNFVQIGQRFKNILVKATDNLDLLVYEIEPDRSDMNSILKSLEAIQKQTDGYKETALNTELEPAKMAA